MDLVKKKIVVIPLSDLIIGGENITDYHIRKDVLDRLLFIKGLSRVVITHKRNEKDYLPQLKAVEMFVFVYCKVAASCLASLETLMEKLPHNLRKKDLILSLDKEVAQMHKVDYMDLDDFLK